MRKSKDPSFVLQNAVQGLLKHEAMRIGRDTNRFLLSQHIVPVYTRRSKNSRWRQRGELLAIPMGQTGFEMDRFLLRDGMLVEPVMSSARFIKNLQLDFDGFYAPARSVYGYPDEDALLEVLADIYAFRQSPAHV
jgi:hypothetical protein